MAPPQRLRAWIDHCALGYFAGFQIDAQSDPVVREFISEAAACRWVAAEAEAMGALIDWLPHPPPEPPMQAC